MNPQTQEANKASHSTLVYLILLLIILMALKSKKRIQNLPETSPRAPSTAVPLLSSSPQQPGYAVTSVPETPV